MRKEICLVVLLSILPAFAWGQSLGDAARKERERREKNKQQGVAAREFSDKEIFGDDDAEEVGADEEQPAPLSSNASGSSSQSSRALEVERKNRMQEESRWRARFQKAKQRVVAARERVQFLKNLNLAAGERYVDVNGYTVIRSLAQLRRLVAAADEELFASEQALSELEEEARRAGVPPGWTR